MFLDARAPSCIDATFRHFCAPQAAGIVTAMKDVSRLLVLTLALLIAVTSQQMATARGMAYDANGQVILCTGQGPITVTVNTQGEPMGVVHICPDCALSLVAVFATPPSVPARVVHSKTLSQTSDTASLIKIRAEPPNARGPPLTV